MFIVLFLQELNDLLQTLLGIGESIPHKERLQHIKPETMATSGIELLSFLNSCMFSLSGIAITVSTPLGTAIRFSTGKIEMHLTNTSHPVVATPIGPLTPKTQFSLVGRVEIDMTLALGYLQDVGPDVVDDLCELAHFKTRISIRNTFENIARSSIPGADESREGAEPSINEAEPTVEVDTFLINILSPHLYIQSRAVEQAILFWLNCKSVYTYWQNERKELTAEVTWNNDYLYQLACLITCTVPHMKVHRLFKHPREKHTPTDQSNQSPYMNYMYICTTTSCCLLLYN